ncbi:hypothetical protein NIES4106_52960 [Fischerella sp. NIES-4106]|jgi:hypothetical protein|nr:hypothetical protein NIES4106_52960 [Fischerella sp. NIES-4106]
MGVIFNIFLVKQALHYLALPNSISSLMPHKESAISVKQATIGTVFSKKIFQQS